jgi:hypothetical protein
MALDSAVILAQIDDVLARYGASKNHPEPPMQRSAHGLPSEVRGNAVQMATSLLAAIHRLAPNSTHARTADAIITRYSLNSPAGITGLMGALAALRADVEAGYMRTLEELVHADVFGDFLEMAEELVGKGYKDAAAVIAGSVLEAHLRQLADNAGIATTSTSGSPLKASRLNDELKAVPVYSALEHKSITAWLALRNDAAHGNYSNYDQKQVEALIRDVRDFMVRHPA